MSIPVELQRAHRFVPIEASEKVLRVGVEAPLTPEAISDLSFATGKRIEQEVVGAAEIARHLARLDGREALPRPPESGAPHERTPSGGDGEATSGGRRGKAGGDCDTIDFERRAGMFGRDSARVGGVSLGLPEVGELAEGPVVQQVDRIIHRAVELGASDIHIEPYEQSVRVRYRLDGVLYLAGELDSVRRDAVVSRIKVLASLDIAEKRRPQDGRVRVTHRPTSHSPFTPGLDRSAEERSGETLSSASTRSIDLRVSVLPTQFGEKVVLRILDRSNLRLDLESLGMGERELALFRRTIEAPHGMILVTGPTGSGKTTTLYAALDVLATGRVNVTTVEDPIEYDIKGVNQTQARADIGFSFAEALRSFLRQDPDVIMVGEIRDTETAEVAIRSALTGHLVLSTLHTNDAPSTVTRLVDMGIEPYLVAASVRLAVAQRLVRTTCPHCRTSLPTDQRLEVLLVCERLLDGKPEGEVTLLQGAGCEACGGTGYRGRAAVFELMPVTETVAELVTGRASTQEIRRCAMEEGMRPLHVAAAEMLARGETTLEEVMRVTSG